MLFPPLCSGQDLEGTWHRVVRRQAERYTQQPCACMKSSIERRVLCVCREEGEKRKVWVAWLNLEAQYGEPPGEAVMALFHRALPYNPPKALHLSLLDVLARSHQVPLPPHTPHSHTRHCMQARSGHGPGL